MQGSAMNGVYKETVVQARQETKYLRSYRHRKCKRDSRIGTLFDKKLCRSQPNPFCATGDDSDLTFEPFRHCFPRSCRALMGVEPLPNIRHGILVERLVKAMRYVADMRRREYIVEGPERVRR